MCRLLQIYSYLFFKTLFVFRDVQCCRSLNNKKLIQRKNVKFKITYKTPTLKKKFF